jgi:omega-amidase
MKITIVQPATVWENKPSNFKNIDQLIRNHFGKTDLVVLPEMFTIGFTLNAEKFAEDTDGETFRWMTNLSQKGNFAVCGSMIIRSADKYFNRFAFVTPQKECFFYDKHHLFSLANENEIFARGISRQIFKYNGFRFIPLICYDLRFPVWSRNRGDYDVMICVASWPDVRRVAWNSLLKARAIENQCYVVGVNRTGIDNEGLKYAGDSVVIDPLGKILGKVNDYEEGLTTVEISLPDLQNFREKFPFWKDADNFSLNI